MGLKYFKNKATGEVTRSLKTLDAAEWEEVIEAPNQKFMVAANKGTGTSKLKDQNAILTARARNHSRDVDMDETIQMNLANGLQGQVKRNLLNSKGERRRKIDDV